MPDETLEDILEKRRVQQARADLADQIIAATAPAPQVMFVFRPQIWMAMAACLVLIVAGVFGSQVFVSQSQPVYELNDTFDEIAMYIVYDSLPEDGML